MSFDSFPFSQSYSVLSLHDGFFPGHMLRIFKEHDGVVSVDVVTEEVNKVRLWIDSAVVGNLS